MTRLLLVVAALGWSLALGCDDGTTAADPPADAAVDGPRVDDDPDAAADAAPDAAPDATPDMGPDAAVGPIVEPYPALAEPVEVIIDAHGMAHIYANDDLDLFFAAGYQQGVDRLFAVDIARRAAVGRRAEVFGPDSSSGDLQSRVLGFQRLARANLRLLAQASPDEARFFAAFAGGLNRRVAEINAGDAPAPPEYAALGFEPEPFEPDELLAIGVRITFGFSSTLEFDLLYTLLGRLAPGGAELQVFAPMGDAFVMGIPDDTAGGIDGEPRAKRLDDTPELDPAAIDGIRRFLRRWRTDLDVGEGSNCWVVGGDHTDDGRPILANDSHARLLDPNIMYPVHLHSADADGTWDAIGMAFTGVPGVQVGHNRHVAWGATTHFADMLDLWDVAITDGMARVGDADVPVEERVEAFFVRQPDGSQVEQRVTVRTVPGVGVILPPEMLDGIPVGLVVQGALLMGWPGFEPGPDALSYFDMARAESVDAWVEAVRLQTVGMQNWMAADATGMRYQTAGRVPDRGPIEGRPSPHSVMDAADPSTLWHRGFLPPEALPALDGSQPYLYSANNDPWGHTADNDPLDDPFYYGSFFAPGFRAATLKRMLPEMLAEGPMTRARSQAMQLDVFSPWADELIPMLTEAVAAIDGDPALVDYVERDDLRAAAERLQLWDRRMTRASAEAALFRMWSEFIGRRMLADDLSLLLAVIADQQPVYVAKFATLALRDRTASLLDMPREQLLLAALDEALAVHVGRGEPTWGDIHRAVLARPDGSTRTLVTPGGDSGLNVAQSRCWDGDTFAETCETTGGAVYRFVTGFDDDGTPAADFACPSCLPESDTPWIEGEFVRLPFRRADVEASAAETRMLLPLDGPAR